MNRILLQVIPALLFFCFAFSSPAAVPVKAVEGVDAPKGLANRTIAVWGSHGRYYDSDRNEWRWQRPHLHQTIEDLYTSSYVIDLLAPMLENAGAYVMMPRERDLNPVEIIIDPDSPLTPGYRESSGSERWHKSSVAGFRMPDSLLTDRQNPFAEGAVREVASTAARSKASTASYTADIPARGTYTVYVSYASLPTSAKAVRYTVNSLRGAEEFVVDQSMGGSTWMRLGEFPLDAGLQTVVTLSNLTGTAGQKVTTDAVKIGGGMGNVLRGQQDSLSVSGLPRWAEGSRYWLQWAGFPVDVYSVTDYENDYKDDYTSRPLWVNYLAGGSTKLPKEKGLNIPVDLSLAIHSDAGVTPDSTTIGTLGIYTAPRRSRLGNGRSRSLCGDLAETIVDCIVNDVRALHDPDWNRRKSRNKSYAETRIPEVPAVILEMLSHQNFADMRHGLNPEFRFTVARAIYKGVLRFLTPKKEKYVVQPLPVSGFAIVSKGNGEYRLEWKATVDSLEETAVPTGYIVELSRNGSPFLPFATVSQPRADFKADAGEFCSFRIVAYNDGGRSFPSEELSLCHLDTQNPEVLVVNGFTRLSAPDWIETDSLAGFLGNVDAGVPYKRNIAFSGVQYNFDRNSHFEDNEVNPGVGASESAFDAVVVAGNTMDYPAVHGRAIVAAGYPIVSTSLAAYLENPNKYPQPITDLILGRQKEIQPGHCDSITRYKAFDTRLQRRIADYLDKGGNLLISGEFVATDLFSNPYSNDSTAMADATFGAEVLGIELEQSRGASNGQIALLPFWGNEHHGQPAAYFNTHNPDTYAVLSPDAIAPSGLGKVTPLIRFAENGNTAAFMIRRPACFANSATKDVSTNGLSSTVIVMSLPFESLKASPGATSDSAADDEAIAQAGTISLSKASDAALRAAVMESFLNCLTTRRRPIAPRPALPAPDPVTLIDYATPALRLTLHPTLTR